MTDEELKLTWQQMSNCNDSMEPTPGDSLSIDLRRRTSRDNLARRYRRFAAIEGAMTAMTPLWFNADFFHGIFRYIIPIAMAVEFLCAAIMDLCLMRGIKTIDSGKMSISRVCALAARYRRMHHLCMCVLIPLSLAIVGMFIYATEGYTGMRVAIATGAAAGVAIGISQYLKFMRDYKRLFKNNL